MAAEVLDEIGAGQRKYKWIFVDKCISLCSVQGRAWSHPDRGEREAIAAAMAVPEKSGLAVRFRKAGKQIRLRTANKVFAPFPDLSVCYRT